MLQSPARQFHIQRMQTHAGCPVLRRAVLKAAERVSALKQLALRWLCSQAAASLQNNREVLVLCL